MKKSVLYLKGLFEGYAIRAEDNDFEWQHFKDVTYHAQILAYDRHLDENIALLIASGHDIGRTYGMLNGKGHGKESAKIVKKVLSDNGFSELYQKKDIDIILRAIENHSKKELIEDEYSELIKDADTLARVDENLLNESDAPEYIRYRALMSKTTVDQVAPLDKWIGTFEKLSGNLLHLWEYGFEEGGEIEWVHHMRTTTRKLRSLVMVFKSLEAYFVEPDFLQNMKIYEKNLVRVLKLLEDVRRLAVMTTLKSQRYHQNKLKNQYQNALKRLQKMMYHETDSLLKIDLHTAFAFAYKNGESWQTQCAQKINGRLKKYILAAAELNGESIKAVHKVRIRGKQIKYLFELGLIENRDEHLSKMVNAFHDLSGEIHDMSDALAFEHAKRYFDMKQLKRHQTMALENLKRYVFYFKKVSKQIKSTPF